MNNETGVGLIIPPPEIRKLVDQTAPYVAKIGPTFEIMVIEKQAGNSQFSFLSKSDPYRAYYDHKVAEYTQKLLQEGEIDQQEEILKGEEEIINNDQQTNQNRELSEAIRKKELELEEKKKQKEKEQQNLEQKSKKLLKAPEPTYFLVNQPKGLTQLDVDVIKHCAQFVAKNGKNFLVSLTEREKQNPQFDFLKPTNDLFPYFMELVESYERCINVKKPVLEQIILNFKDKNSIYKKCLEIYEYENFQKEEQRKIEQLEEEERKKLADIDWNDFVVVETIDFMDDETAETEPYQKA